MKPAYLMLAVCALLSGCTTPLPQAPHPIMTPVATVPRAAKASEPRIVKTDDVDLTQLYIRISGNVGSPGFYLLGSNTSTLLRAVVAARGASWRAPQRVEIHRVDGSVDVYGFAEIETGKIADPVLRANDHVHVPQRNLLGF